MTRGRTSLHPDGPPVVPLWVRSGWSLLRGTALPGDLAELAAGMGHRALALTDVNGLYGQPAFCKAADAHGVRPIVGAELRDEDGPGSAVALVTDETGYANLCRLITRRFPPLDDGQLGAAAGGGDESAARVSAGLVGDLAAFQDGLEIVVEDPVLAERLLAAGVDSRRLWMGVDPPGQAPWRVSAAIEASDRLGVGLTATGKALLARAGDVEAARLLAAIRTGRTLQTVGDDELPHPRHSLRTPQALAAGLKDLPRAVEGNRRLAERCAAFRLLPRRAVFPSFPCPDGQPARVYLRGLCGEGLVRRYGAKATQAARARLARELELIEKMGFSEYFLVVWDIVQFARSHGAPVAGRGSGASSLVAYLLGITNVCPLRYHIPFERFLNEGREDFPDLDVDFCWRLRDEVIAYAFRRWGQRHVAMVSMHTTFQPRSAFRETAKAMGLSDDQISRMMRTGRPRELLEAVHRRSRSIANLPHALSVHPGGIVITPGQIDGHAPIQPAAKGVMITQYDKDGVEDVGLVKLDLLGNRNLSTVRYAIGLIEQRCGVRIDPDTIRPDDGPTRRLLQAADTVGCNQLESPAMRRLLKMMQPTDAADVMQALALIRPGAANVGGKETFIRRRRGLDPVPPPAPQLDGLLEDTYGVMLYEDDVMLVAAALTGSSLADGDRFRKATRKCRSEEEVLALSRRFLDRCRQAGVAADVAGELWVQMAKFNAYSFCRAHAASYALLSYAGAYLKAHYPLEFWVASLNNNQSMYPHRVYVEQARRAGVRFLLPDVGRSGAEFTLDEEAIRVGLGHVAGIGPAGVERILFERGRRQYESLSDLMERTHLGREEARSLVLVGAMDRFGRRPTLMTELALFGRPSGSRARAGRSQGTLLSPQPIVPESPRDYPEIKKDIDERRLLGFGVRGHLMERLRPMVQAGCDADSRDLPGRIGRMVRLAGFIETRRTTPARTGGDVLFLTFDDEYGLFEASVMPDMQRRLGAGLDQYGPYLVTGRVEEQYGAVSVSVTEIELRQLKAGDLAGLSA